MLSDFGFTGKSNPVNPPKRILEKTTLPTEPSFLDAPITAMDFGENTLSMFVFIFLVPLFYNPNKLGNPRSVPISDCRQASYRDDYFKGLYSINLKLYSQVY